MRMALDTTTEKPVVIVGAGVAGLAAASQLGEAGIPVIVLEARERIGGRIFTKRDAVTDAPVELGAEFIHGMPPEIWQELEPSRIEEVEGRSWCVQGGRLRPCDFFSQVDEILGAMDDSVPDESFLDFLKRKFPNSSQDAGLEEAKRRAIGYVSGFNAADPSLVSVHWLVAESRAEEKIHGDRAFRPVNGYADLIEAFRQKIAQHDTRVETGTIVERIVWKAGEAQVESRGAQGGSTITAQQVLVTLPLSLLQSGLKTSGSTGVVAFVPALPQEKVAALDKLEMGAVVRVVLGFKERFWDTVMTNDGSATLSDMGFLLSDDESFPTWWTTMPRLLPLITGWAPFRAAERLSGQDQRGVARQAVTTLSSLMGVQNLENKLEAVYFHDWQSDPFSRGAYSYAKVGADGAQARLGAPLEKTLFFAGEATDTSGNNGTVHGAIASGYRAAQEILETRRPA
jgi:monoamine oxidase